MNHREKKFYKVLSLQLCMLCFCSALICQSVAEEFNKVCEDHGLIGSTLVTICGEEVTTYNFGESHLDPSIEVNDLTKYRIASISKLVTAVGAMILVDDGLLDLDEDVSTYLGWTLRNPGFPDVVITPRMLLSHRSSIIDGGGYSNFIGSTFNQWPPAPLSQLLIEDGSDYSADMFNAITPGTYFNYSNVNFVTVGTVIEAVSGQRFDVFFKERLFDPLGIDGGFNIHEITDYQNLATLYRNDLVQQDDYYDSAPVEPDLDTYVVGGSAQLFGPQGSLRVSVEELSRVLQVLMNEGKYNETNILSPESTEQMLNEEWTYNGSNGNNYFGLFQEWGLGVHHTTNQVGEDIVFQEYDMSGHAGEAYGLISDLYFTKEIPMGFVWMTNGYHPGFSYEFASNSSYYQVESALYKMLEEQVLEGCKATATKSIENLPTLTYSQADSNLNLTISESIDKLRIIDVQGKAYYSSDKKGTSYTVHSKGLPTIIIVVMERDGKRWSKKLILY